MGQVDWGARRAAALVILAAASAYGGDARAQNRAGDDENFGKSTGTTVAAPEGRGYRLEASMNTLYDGNILRLGDGFQLRNGASRSDFRFTPLVSGAIGLPVGRQQFFVGAQVGRDIYARNTRLDRNRYALGGGLNWRLARSCTGSITGEYKRRQSLLSEASVQSDNTQEIQDYSASGDCAPPIGIGFGGGVSRNVTNNNVITRQALDARTNNFDGHLNFGAPGLGQFSAGGNFSQISYPRRTLFVADGASLQSVSDKLDLYQGRVSYSRAVGVRLSVSASASYIKVKPKPRDVLDLVDLPGIGTVPFPRSREGYSGPGYTLGIDYHPGVRLSASLDATRNVTSSPTVGAQFVVRDSITAAINYNLGPAVTTSIGGNYDRNQYKGSFATVDDPLPRTRDTITRFFARATYAPRPLYAVDVEVAHQNRDANPSLYNFSSTSASLTLRVKFGRG